MYENDFENEYLNSCKNYSYSSRLANNIIHILIEENRFEYIEESTPNIITCYFHGSNLFSENNDLYKPIFYCSFDIYPDNIEFFLYFNFDKNVNENIIRRLNSELPFLQGQINTGSSIPFCIDVLNRCEVRKFRSINSNVKYKKLKTKIDLFFDNYVDKITDKIMEIMLNVVL